MAEQASAIKIKQSSPLVALWTLSTCLPYYYVAIAARQKLIAHDVIVRWFINGLYAASNVTACHLLHTTN